MAPRPNPNPVVVTGAGDGVGRSRLRPPISRCGEDHLVERALGMTDRDLRGIWQLAAQYEDTAYPLPDPGQGITHNHFIAYAAVTYFEGHLRPLARGRRRPQKDRPAQVSSVS
jgi:hypothetical protein